MVIQTVQVKKRGAVVGVKEKGSSTTTYYTKPKTGGATTTIGSSDKVTATLPGGSQITFNLSESSKRIQDAVAGKEPDYAYVTTSEGKVGKVSTALAQKIETDQRIEYATAVGGSQRALAEGVQERVLSPRGYSQSLPLASDVKVQYNEMIQARREFMAKPNFTASLQGSDAFGGGLRQAQTSLIRSGRGSELGLGPISSQIYRSNIFASGAQQLGEIKYGLDVRAAAAQKAGMWPKYIDYKVGSGIVNFLKAPVEIGGAVALSVSGIGVAGKAAGPVISQALTGISISGATARIGMSQEPFGEAAQLAGEFALPAAGIVGVKAWSAPKTEILPTRYKVETSMSQSGKPYAERVLVGGAETKAGSKIIRSEYKLKGSETRSGGTYDVLRITETTSRSPFNLGKSKLTTKVETIKFGLDTSGRVTKFQAITPNQRIYGESIIKVGKAQTAGGMFNGRSVSMNIPKGNQLITYQRTTAITGIQEGNIGVYQGNVKGTKVPFYKYPLSVSSRTRYNLINVGTSLGIKSKGVLIKTGTLTQTYQPKASEKTGMVFGLPFTIKDKLPAAQTITTSEYIGKERLVTTQIFTPTSFATTFEYPITVKGSAFTKIVKAEGETIKSMLASKKAQASLFPEPKGIITKASTGGTITRTGRRRAILGGIPRTEFAVIEPLLLTPRTKVATAYIPLSVSKIKPVNKLGTFTPQDQGLSPKLDITPIQRIGPVQRLTPVQRTETIYKLDQRLITPSPTITPPPTGLAGGVGIVPGFIIPPPKISLPFAEFGRGRGRSGGSKFSPKYFASLSATAFNIRGKRSKLAELSGLGIRPIAR